MAKVGMIIIRQRGTKYLLGKNVKMGSDNTIYAMKDGIVRFGSKSKIVFNRTKRIAKIVSVEPITEKAKPIVEKTKKIKTK